MSTRTRKRKVPIVARISPGGAIAIVVMGIFAMCLIVILSKAVFVSNSKDVPEGIDTATIADTNTQPTDSSDAVSAAATSVTTSATTAAQSTTPQTTTTKKVVKMKIIDVTYLKAQPDENSENVMYLSPNIEVDILETLDNGWTKITFLNVTGQLTGYVQTSFLY
jgi:hypothetical protein